MQTLELAQRCYKLSDRHLRTMMGYLNALLHSAAKFYGAIEKIGDTTHIIPAALTRILDKFSITVPLTYLKDYLQQHWITILTSLPTLRKIRSFFEEIGIFRVEEQKFLGSVPKRDRDGYTRATYHDFDLKLALETYQQLEKIYLERSSDNFEALPPHKGSFVQRLYNAVFTCSVGMNRKAGNFGTLPMTMEEAAHWRSQTAMSANSATRQSIQSVAQSMDEFKRIGLDKKEPEIFGWMRSHFEDLKRRYNRQMRDLPY